MSILQISVCIPEWQAVICEASWMKWWRRDFCSEDSDEKGSTGRVRRLFVGEVGDGTIAFALLALAVVVYMNSPGEYSVRRQHLSLYTTAVKEYKPNFCIPSPTHAPNLDRENARPPHCSCIAYRHCAPAV